MNTENKNTPRQQEKKYDDCAENGNSNNNVKGSAAGAEPDENHKVSEQEPSRPDNEHASGRKAYETQDPAPFNETDSGQGAPGIQGQYPGSNDQHLYPKPGTAPDRPDTDSMNREGSSQVALGSRKSDSDRRREE